jgi:flagellar hook-length control protein FliK
VAPAVIDRVAEAVVAHLDRENNTAVIQLEPAELGKLHIDLAVEGDKVQIRIITEAPETSTLIQAHLAELKSALQHHSLDLGLVSVDVNTGRDGREGAANGSQQQAELHDGRPRNAFIAERRHEGEEKRKRHPYARPQSGVSVWA